VRKASSAQPKGKKVTAQTEGSTDTKGPVVIKKYANRRLYNTSTSSYVTLDYLCKMVKDNVDFVVYDARTGDDITRSVLTQIIVEEEAKGHNLLPTKFLRQLISYYDDSLQWMVPQYLDHMMETLARNQDSIRRSMQDTFGSMFPFTNLEEMSRQNMAFMESAMKLLSPVGVMPTSGEGTQEKTAEENGSEKPDEDQEARLEDLKRQVEELRRQMAEIATKSE
jgi:polyhydroxyalkanoate synthesis repressor PhaR